MVASMNNNVSYTNVFCTAECLVVLISKYIDMHVFSKLKKVKLTKDDYISMTEKSRLSRLLRYTLQFCKFLDACNVVKTYIVQIFE